jgi:hypothetical protein
VLLPREEEGAVVTRILAVRFDVSALSEEELSGLAMEVVVQAESSERHPDVPVVSTVVEHDLGEAV